LTAAPTYEAESIPPPPEMHRCCAGLSDGSFLSNVSLVVDYGLGAQSDVGFLAVQSAERFQLVLGAPVGATSTVDESTAGLYMRRCSWSGHAYATIWTPSACITIPVPDVCLARGARMCFGSAHSSWPAWESHASIDAEHEIKTFVRADWTKEEDALSRIFVLRRTCAPIALHTIVGPNVHANATTLGGSDSLMRWLASFVSSSGAGAGDNSVPWRDAAARILDAQLAGSAGCAPKASRFNWLSGTFLNSTFDRPDDSVFGAPARCHASFPEGHGLS
jgi:hypothetical protein